jgi:hypothetical protein
MTHNYHNPLIGSAPERREKARLLVQEFRAKFGTLLQQFPAKLGMNLYRRVTPARRSKHNHKGGLK